MNLHERAASFIELAAQSPTAPLFAVPHPEWKRADWAITTGPFTHWGSFSRVALVPCNYARLFIAAPDMAALIAEMDARIRELEADAERLDWLENNEAVLASHREEIDEGEYAIFWQVADRLRKKSLSGHPLGSPRDALDAARKEQTT